jgi:hypothetical protein
MISLIFFISIFNFQHWRKITYKELWWCGILDMTIESLLVVGIFGLAR